MPFKRPFVRIREFVGKILIDQFVLEDQQLLVESLVCQQALFNNRRVFRCKSAQQILTNLFVWLDIRFQLL